MSKEQLTSADVNMIVVAAQILAKRQAHVTSVDLYRSREISVFLSREAFRQAADLTGQSIIVKPRGTIEYPWEAEVWMAGVRFYAIFKAEDLPIIGYYVPGYVAPATGPVPIPVQAEGVAV